MKRQYYSSGMWGQDTQNRDACARSRGVDGDCCDQGLVRCPPDCARSIYRSACVYRSASCRDRCPKSDIWIPVMVKPDIKLISKELTLIFCRFSESSDEPELLKI